jgi:phthiocerol/phenolphthiocerol synthesis type-I polyketide synthase C
MQQTLDASDAPAAGMSPGSLVAVVRRQARQRPGHPALIFLPDGESETARLPFGELDRRARAFAAHLQQQGLAGRHVLLMLPTGVHYVVAFLGALYAGAIPVPGYPPSNSMHADRMAHIAADCDAAAAVVAQAGRDAATPQLACPAIVVDDSGRVHGGAHESSWTVPTLAPETIAYLQYTSGSTSQPRGVVVTHGNLLAHAASWQAAPGLDHDDVFVTWLPLFHDMGLILGVVQMLYAGGTIVMMPPLAFLQRPLRWLHAIHRYRGTASYAPNFAYELCASAAERPAPGALDLSSWCVAGNGAEPVKADTLARFAERFAAHGLRPEAMNPGYGLAEATLTVTRQPRLLRAPELQVDAQSLGRGLLQPARDGARATTLVSCGRTWSDTQALIVDPHTCTPCRDGAVGEVWVAGPVVTHGYWQRAEATRDSFAARLADGRGPFMRSGDLGVLSDGHLYITGRIKDVIVIRGQNHYPQDIEHTVQRAHAALEPGHGAAFSVEVDDEERLVVVQEVRRTQRHRIAGAEVVQAIRAAVAEVHGLQLHAVQLLRPASVHVTSSGKIQRQACRASFLAGDFELLHAWVDQPGATPPPAAQATPAAAPLQPSRAAIADWLAERIAGLRHLPARDIGRDRPFTALGLDSLELVTLSGELSTWLRRIVEPTLLYRWPSIDVLARHLSGEAQPHAAAPRRGPAPAEPIAVVGIACRLPQANSADAFWRLLDDGVDAITEVPASRWDAEAWHDGGTPSPGKSASKWGGFIDDIDRFDAHFFGISPREANGMDPQQRVLLHTAWHALEDAGIAPDTLSGSDTGVFIGAMTHDYQLLQLTQRAAPDAYFGTGTQASILANRISYVLGLQGPSWTVDTACSSSLVALHNARSSLLSGECELAIVGGVNALLSPDLFVALSQAQMLSPDGRCRAFDARANGYVRGEGCVVLVLKRLGDALRDKDRIHGVIAGSAVNQDGRSNGLTAPNGQAQQAVMRRALAVAGFAPESVSYVEAHGTGTALGDPIEVDALQQTYGVSSPDHPRLWIGSVKSNIGHTEAAAGLAGLVKVLLALRHERIPQTLHVQRLNPHLPLDAGRCAVAAEAQPWPRGMRPRRAAVSSFGFGGANAHVLVQEAPSEAVDPDRAATPPRIEVLALSAKTVQSLRQSARQFASFLDDEHAPALHAVCHTANARRARLPHRLAIAGESAQEIAGALRRFADDGADAADVPSGNVLGAPSARTAFLFTGQGAQYAGMGQGLYRSNAVFRDTMQRCDEILRPLLGLSLTRALYGDEGESLDLGRTSHAQPALFSLEMALTAAWQSLGVRPDCLLGHSLGEYVAACVAGVFDLEDGLRLVAQRGRLMDTQTAPGLMVALHGPEATISGLMCDFASSEHQTLAIAARNTADSLVLSGAPDAVQRLVAQWTRHGIVATPLQVSRAFHSPLMHGMLPEFERCLRAVRLRMPAIPLVSNLSGRFVGEEITDPAYWVEHAAKPVEFLAGMRSLEAAGCGVFVEMGPHPVLAALGRQTIASGLWLPSLRRRSDDTRQFAQSLAAWSAHGGEVDWLRWTQDRASAGAAALPRPVALPAYPFQSESYWFNPEATAAVPPTARAEPSTPIAADTPDEAQQHDRPCPVMLATLPPHEATARLLDYLRRIAFGVLHLGAAQRAELTPVFDRLALNQLGLDSLMAVELRNRVRADLGAELSLKHFLVGTTAGDVATHIYRLVAVQQLSRTDTSRDESALSEELVL